MFLMLLKNIWLVELEDDIFCWGFWRYYEQQMLSKRCKGRKMYLPEDWRGQDQDVEQFTFRLLPLHLLSLARSLSNPKRMIVEPSSAPQNTLQFFPPNIFLSLTQKTLKECVRNLSCNNIQPWIRRNRIRHTYFRLKWSWIRGAEGKKLRGLTQKDYNYFLKKVI